MCIYIDKHDKVCMYVSPLGWVVVGEGLLHIHLCLLLNYVQRQIHVSPFGVVFVGSSTPNASPELCQQTNRQITFEGGVGSMAVYSVSLSIIF